jgi:uncharacterized protein involved in type VI secretion and phage assembly
MSNSDQLGTTDGAPRIQGVTTAKVTNNEDPEGLGRVKVTYPFRDTADESSWARVVTEMASTEYGTFFLPEPGDEVLVAFEDGKIEHPVVIGSLYNGKRPPPYDNGDGNNEIRAVTSRNEHKLEFDDASTGGTVTIETSAGHTITLDDSAGSETVTIEDKTGSNRMEMDSNAGEVSVSADEKISLDAKKIELSATKKVDISSNSKVTVSGNGEVDVSGSTNLKLSSGANGKLECGAILEVKGALVKIN